MPRKWQMLLIVSLASFMSSLDVFIVNVAFPSIERQFPGTELSALSWVLNGYAIIFAAFLVPAGRLADRIGHRRAFLAGMVVFTAGSALCGLALSPGMLIAARVIQAMGAALITPASLALLLPAFPPKERGLVVGIWAAIGAIAASLGPTVGGLLVPISWRLVFFVNVPVGLACAVATLALAPNRRDAEPGAQPDWLGASVLALAIAALSLDIVEGAGWGWLSLRTVGLALVVALLLWSFVARSQRHPAPVVDLSLVRVRSFVLACCGTAMIGGALAAVLLSQILFVTTQWHFSTLQAGLSITPGPLVAGTCAILGGRLNGRVSPRLLTTIGAVAFALAAAWWALFMRREPDYVTGMLPGMLLSGVGVGFTFAPLTSLAAASLPVDRAATGMGVVNMARQIGTALGIAIFVAIVGTPGPSTPLSTFQHGWLFILLLAVLDGFAVRALRAPARRQVEVVDEGMVVALE